MMADEKKLCELIDERTYPLLEKDFEAFSRGAELDKRAKERIMSSVMRKAGIEMENNITIKNTKKRSKRFIGFMAAAAIMVTGSVGAGAAYVIKSRTTNEAYFGAGAEEKLESLGAKVIKTIELEHFELNIESMLSDGQYLTVTAEAVPTDKEGEKILKLGGEPFLHTPLSEVLNTPTETIFDEDINNQLENGRQIMRWTYLLDEQQDSAVIPMSLHYTDIGESGGYKSLGEFELEFVKNMDTIKLENAKGEAVSLSSNSVTGNGVTIEVATDPLPFREVSVEYKDGTVKKIEVYGSALLDTNESGYYDKMGITFLDLVDTENVSRITIGATTFEVKG